MRKSLRTLGIAVLLLGVVAIGNFVLASFVKIQRSDLGIPGNLDDEACYRPEVPSPWRMFGGFPSYNGQVVAHQFGVYAAYASNAYKPERAKTFDLRPEAFGWERRGNPIDRMGGFHADVYHRDDGDRLAVMVVFRGTDGPLDIADLLTNASYFTQMLNPWDQYRTARKAFVEVREDAKAAARGRPVGYYAVGHSLGGGLARHMAAAFPCVSAIVFNSSFVSNDFRLARPFFNLGQKEEPKDSAVIDLFEEDDQLTRVAVYQNAQDFFRLNPRRQWYRAYNVPPNRRQHEIFFAAQAMARIPVDCLKERDCELWNPKFGGRTEVSKLYCVANPVSQRAKREMCPVPAVTSSKP